MKIAFIGNVAQNSYLNAKFMRQYSEHDAWCFFEKKPIGNSFHPQQEDALIIDGQIQDNWQLPKWCIQLPSIPPSPQVTYKRLASWLSFSEKEAITQHLPVIDCLDYVLDEIVPRFDIIVLAGFQVFLGLFFDKKPYFAFECSTLRNLSRIQSLQNQVLKISYQHSKLTWITNPDTRKYAIKFNIPHTFMLHPVDIYEKFTPEGLGFLEEEDKPFPICFAPARHVKENDLANKGNRKLIRAFNYFQKENFDSKLLLTKQGDYVEANAAYVQSFPALQNKVTWLPFVCKKALARIYRTADICIDQFDIGSWGTSGLEALACGKPCLGYIESRYLDWCRDILSTNPPYCQAKTEADILRWLKKLSQSLTLRQEYAILNREWMLQNHAPEKIVMLHLKEYEKQ